jgi:MinD superfamily P-loop ATPase
MYLVMKRAFLASVFKDAILIDADVEEPNASIFLKPVVTETEKVYVEYPVVDSNRCMLCGKCGDLCKFNAIIIRNKIVKE